MAFQLSKLPELVSVVVRHVSAYLELAASETTNLGNLLIRQLMLAAAAILCGSFAVAIACAWIIIAAWNTQWKYLSLGILLMVFMIGAGVALLKLLQRPASGTPVFNRLRTEWNEDQQLLAELLDSPEDGDADHVHVAASAAGARS